MNTYHWTTANTDLVGRLVRGEITKEEARAELEAIPGLVERIAEAEAQLDEIERRPSLLRRLWRRVRP